MVVNCEVFLAEYSSLCDGLLSDEVAVEMEVHRDECESCARYDRVLRQGTELFRALPELEVSDDFGARLQHRIWHVEDEMAWERTQGSRGSVAATLSIAAMIAFAAWVPTARSTPSLPTVAAGPPQLRERFERAIRIPDLSRFNGQRGFAAQLADLGVPVLQTPYDVALHGSPLAVESYAQDLAAAQK
jgi:anti-sigma factor RsiW